MAKINEIKAVINGMASKPPVAVVSENNDAITETKSAPIKKEVTPVRN